MTEFIAPVANLPAVLKEFDEVTIRRCEPESDDSVILTLTDKQIDDWDLKRLMKKHFGATVEIDCED